jgi:hypothetical protein
MVTVLTTWKAEIRRIVVKSNQKILQDPISMGKSFSSMEKVECLSSQ